MPDYYDDSPDKPAAPQQPPAKKEKDQESEGSETALVPKSLCPGMKPGDEFTVRIERELEDQYEISYPEQKEGPHDERAESEQGAEAGPPSEMRSYMD